MKKRLLALLLVCIMLASFMAIPVMAEDGENPPASQSEGNGDNPPNNDNNNPPNDDSNNPPNDDNNNPPNDDSNNPPNDDSNDPPNDDSNNPPNNDNNNPPNDDSNDPPNNDNNNPPNNDNNNPPDGGNGDNNDSTETTGCSHSWGTGTVTKAATCSAEGNRYHKCSLCGEEKNESIAKLAHTYTYTCSSVCTVCKAERTVTHTAGSGWAKSAAGHYRICTVCKERFDMRDHVGGPAATEEKDQLCLSCGYVLTKKKGHTHKPAEQYSSDNTGHWYACSTCDDQVDFDSHSFEDTCTSVCEDCGYEITPQHDYDGEWLSDETGHWMVCAGCGADSEVQSHVPGDEATEESAQLCTVCGYEIAPKLPGETDEQEELWQIDDINHWKLGPNGETLEKGAHTWDQGMDRWDGKLVFSCTVCHAERVEGKTVTETEEPGGKMNGPLILLIVLIVLFVAASATLVWALVAAKKQSGKYSNKNTSNKQ